MQKASATARSIVVVLAVGAVCVAGVVILTIASWLAWPGDEGSSTYSTAANVAQLGLVLAGAAAAGFSVRAVVADLGPSRALLLAALAVACWVLWWVLFPGLDIGDSTAVD
jgi:hypothetical protein